MNHLDVLTFTSDLYCYKGHRLRGIETTAGGCQNPKIAKHEVFYAVGWSAVCDCVIS